MSAPVGQVAHLAPVELDDEGRPGRRRRRRPGRWVRRHAAGVTAAAVALVLVLLGVQSWLDARERARLRYLAEVPGVLRALADPPGVLWRWTPERRLPRRRATARVAGRSAPTTSRAGWTCAASTPDTGDRRWSVPFSLDAALPPGGRSEFPSVWVRCTTAPSGDAPLAVCAAEVSPVASGGAATPLAVLDPARLGPRDTDRPGRVAVGGDRRPPWCAPRPAADGRGGVRWTLTATDPVTGAVQWRAAPRVVPRSTRCGSATT